MATLSIIKAEVSSIGGHVAPSKKLMDTISRFVVKGLKGLLTDYYLGNTGEGRAGRGLKEVSNHLNRKLL